MSERCKSMHNVYECVHGERVCTVCMSAYSVQEFVQWVQGCAMCKRMYSVHESVHDARVSIVGMVVHSV